MGWLVPSVPNPTNVNGRFGFTIQSSPPSNGRQKECNQDQYQITNQDQSNHGTTTTNNQAPPNRFHSCHCCQCKKMVMDQHVTFSSSALVLLSGKISYGVSVLVGSRMYCHCHEHQQNRKIKKDHGAFLWQPCSSSSSRSRSKRRRNGLW